MKTRIGFVGLVAFAAFTSPASAQDSLADPMLDAARIAAKADRHDEAIAGFRRVITLAPDRRHEFLLELADQLTWSKQYAEAIPLYREATTSGVRERAYYATIGLARALARDGQYRTAIAAYDRALAVNPQDRDVRLARAQVLSWANRLGAAHAAYDAVLRDHPDDLEARRGKAQMLSWRGRHRAAVLEARTLLTDRPGDPEATRIMAESLIWMGRPDRAQAVLQARIAAEPDDNRAVALLDAVKQDNRPQARVDWRMFDQSDNLGISELSVDLRAPLASGRAFAGARYTRATYRPGQSAAQRITVDRPSLYGHYRLSDALELNGAIAVEIIDRRGAEQDYNRLTFESYATIRPNDIVRFDIGVSRATFDSEDTLAMGLTATQFGASVDVQPDHRTTLSARLSRTDFSDGNRRGWWQVEASRRILDRPRVNIGYRYTAFDFRLTGRPGYYNPDRFSSHELVLRGSGHFTRTLRWDMRLVGGYETEKQSGSRATVNVGASVAQAIGSALELEAAYDFSTSRTQSTGGFERGIARLTLRARF